MVKQSSSIREGRRTGNYILIWSGPTDIFTHEIIHIPLGKSCSKQRGGHYYTYCTDTRDRDQNLIGPILGLDRLILARKLP